jgi:hypothetical protein
MVLRRPATLLVSLLAAACGTTVQRETSGGATGGAVGPPTVLSTGTVDKLDLLLVIDDSSTMAAAQQILAIAIPDMVATLVSPPCVTAGTSTPIGQQPARPLDACPAGSVRAFNPVRDMHVGVITSSLGSFGATACPETAPPSCPSATSTPADDHGHLITRADVCGTSTVPTYNGLGYLQWDPGQTLSPPGIADISAIGVAGPGSGSGLVGALHDIVVGVGAEGCVVASQNEAWYRFLVDPHPWQAIQAPQGVVTTSGVDTSLLEQRGHFLRPDSLLLIVNVTDKPDSSIKEYSSYPVAADFDLSLPSATPACTMSGPLSPCCVSCGQPTPVGCAPSPACTSNPGSPASENPTLRRFGLIQLKAAYGIEFYYPPSRYVNALTSLTVADENGNTVMNPVYSNLNPSVYHGSVRDPSRVFYATLAGVPWQLLARQKDGVPDLVNGVSAIDPVAVGGFRTSTELSLTDGHGHTYWDDLAGDPESYVAPLSPFMVESTAPRSGADPITGALVSPPTTPNGAGSRVGNPSSVLNDHERTIPSPPGDIEYACVFPLLSPIDEHGGVAGECAAGPADSPLCSPNPNDNGQPTLQTSAKAYPGTKHLAIAHGLGNQGIAASLCPAQMSDPTRPDFGFRPAVGAVTSRLKAALDGECLPRRLSPDADGQVACTIVVGSSTPANGGCSCSGPGLSPGSAGPVGVVQAAQATPAGANLDCFCVLAQLDGTGLQDCQTSSTPSSNGWCYVEASQGPAQAARVAQCSPASPQEIRFVGPSASTGTLFISCSM